VITLLVLGHIIALIRFFTRKEETLENLTFGGLVIDTAVAATLVADISLIVVFVIKYLP